MTFWRMGPKLRISVTSDKGGNTPVRDEEGAPLVHVTPVSSVVLAAWCLKSSLSFGPDGAATGQNPFHSGITLS